MTTHDDEGNKHMPHLIFPDFLEDSGKYVAGDCMN